MDLPPGNERAPFNMYKSVAAKAVPLTAKIPVLLRETSGMRPPAYRTPIWSQVVRQHHLR